MIEIEDRVKELGFGRWEGRLLAEIMEKELDLWEARKVDRWNGAAPGGESYRQMDARLRTWLSGVSEEDRLVVVSHPRPR